MATLPVYVTAAVEGDIDEAVLRRVAHGVGIEILRTHGKKGKAYLRKNLAAFNHAATHGTWVVLMDLDLDAPCAPEFLKSIAEPAANLRLRLAIREVEAWLMADSEELARFLAISESIIPRDPENVLDPKAQIVSLAARSRQRAIREDMIPSPGSKRVVGRAYTSRMIEYATRYWRPDVAVQHSDSLLRCVKRLSEMAGKT
jgi:hypothetical protein